jgi:hypothetical protein
LGRVRYGNGYTLIHRQEEKKKQLEQRQSMDSAIQF